MSKIIFFKGVSYSYIRQLVALITNIISLPLLLNYFGSVNYGVWVLILGLTGYINTISFGIPSAMTTLVANTTNLSEKYQILKKSFFLLSLFSSFFIFIFIIAINHNDSWIISLLGNIDEEYVYSAKFIFTFFVVFTLLKLPFDLFIQFFTGMNAVYNSEIYAIIKALTIFMVVLLTVYFDLDLLIFVMFWLVGDLFVSLFSIFHVFIKYSYLKREAEAEKSLTKKDILKSGFAFFQVGLAASIVWSTDNLVISHFLSPDFVTTYSIAFKIFTYIFMFSAILNGVVAPMYGNAYANKDFEKIRKLTNLVYKILPLVGACVWVFLILFSKEIITLWTGNDEAFGGYLLFFSLGLYGYVLSYVNTYATLLYSLNFANKIYSVAWLEALLNLVLSIILIKFMGIGGVALGTAISALMISFVLPRFIGKLTGNEVIYDHSYATKQLFILVVPAVTISLLTMNLFLIYKVFIFLIIFPIMVFSSWMLLNKGDKFMFFSFLKVK
ncbi:MATE family efflux transporter [Marinomonas sp.]|uniref:MATE family efflux transporter n=1 Tax=Marinomonas sp. TaxID=1904862 RepID=UPI003A91431A